MARPSKEIQFTYEPREQFLDFHQRKTRFSCLVCHRRAGKTVACVNELAIRALYTTKKNARYAYIAPTFTQAKDIAWTYLKAAVEGIAVAVRESELRVILPNGAWITLYGSDNPDRLRGLYHDGLVCDEFGDCRPSLWGEVLLPTLVDRNGWAVFIGTPKGKNHFYHINERAKAEEKWYQLTLPASTSGILTEDQINDMRPEMTEAQFEQEMMCSFTAAVRGTYYASLISELEEKGQIATDVCEYNPEQKVFASADLGFTDSTAFWFWQPRPDGLAIIDYEEHQGRSLDFYFKMLKEKGYDYDTIWLPHDARAKTLQTGRSTVEQFLEQKLPIQIVPSLKVQHGIDAARKVLPLCWIDSNKCYNGVEALRAYRRKYDEINKVYTEKPLHDHSSDGADAFRYLSLVARMGAKTIASDIIKRPRETPKAQLYTLNDLFKDNEKSGKSKIIKMRL